MDGLKGSAPESPEMWNLKWSERRLSTFEKIHFHHDNAILKAVGGRIGSEGPDLEARVPFASTYTWVDAARDFKWRVLRRFPPMVVACVVLWITSWLQIAHGQRPPSSIFSFAVYLLSMAGSYKPLKIPKAVANFLATYGGRPKAAFQCMQGYVWPLCCVWRADDGWLSVHLDLSFLVYVTGSRKPLPSISKAVAYLLAAHNGWPEAAFQNIQIYFYCCCARRAAEGRLSVCACL